MAITVIGSINMDYTTKTQNLPQRGETLLSTYFNTAPGGKGANQAVAASRLGCDVNMIAAVGNDVTGNSLINRLKEEKINVDGVSIVDCPTGNAMITLDVNGSNTIVVYPGANNQVTIDKINDNIEMIKKSDVIILQLEIPVETVIYAVQIATENNIPVILNPAPAHELPREIYKNLDYITPNETELTTLTGETDIESGAKKLMEWGVKTVVVTMGSAGCLYMDGEKTVTVPSFKANAIDTTAAGDSFNGALAVGLVEGKKMEDILRFANAVGSLTTTKLGAQDALPFRNEVEELLSR